VLARVLPAVPGAVAATGGKVPTGSALSQARARLPIGPDGEPVRRLFEATAAEVIRRRLVGRRSGWS
jgi:hypothetical protein